MPNERECDFTVGQWTAYDEMIVAMYQDAYERAVMGHKFDTSALCTHAIIGNWITDREVVHHPSLLGRQIQVAMHFFIVEGADARRP